MVERLSLHRLAYFVTAADIGTMSGAAQHLYVSQSAVSLGIAELERRLGVQLMLRSKAKGLSLTEAGRHLLPRARALLTQAEDLEADVRHERHSIAGRLVVGCFTSIGPFLLPRLLEAFQAAYPEVFLDFIEGSLVELQQSLRDGRCELAMLYDVGIETDIDYEELYGCHPYVLVSPDHPLADKEKIRLSELASHDMIMMDFPPSMQYFNEILVDAGVNPIIRHRTQSFELTRSLVARGFGYSLLIQRPVTDVTYEGRGLRVRSIADDVAPLPVVLAWHAATRLSPRAVAFATFCRTVIRQGNIIGDRESPLLFHGHANPAGHDDVVFCPAGAITK
jgi:DNA-binding transcriptional LysR family regulator